MKIETFEAALIASSGWAWQHRLPFTFETILAPDGVLSVLMNGRVIIWAAIGDDGSWLDVCDFGQRESFSGAAMLRGGVAWVLAAMSDASRRMDHTMMTHLQRWEAFADILSDDLVNIHVSQSDGLALLRAESLKFMWHNSQQLKGLK